MEIEREMSEWLATIGGHLHIEASHEEENRRPFVGPDADVARQRTFRALPEDDASDRTAKALRWGAVSHIVRPRRGRRT